MVGWGVLGGEEATSLLIDPDRGELVPLAEGVTPAADVWIHPRIPPPGAPATRLFVKDRLQLLVWRSGRLEPLHLR